MVPAPPLTSKSTALDATVHAHADQQRTLERQGQRLEVLESGRQAGKGRRNDIGKLHAEIETADRPLVTAQQGDVGHPRLHVEVSEISPSTPLPSRRSLISALGACQDVPS